MGVRGFVVAALLLSSVPSFAGRDIWTSGGPVGGFVAQLAVAPSSSNVVYVTSPGGDFRSTDGGKTWTALSAPPGVFPVWSLAVDAASPFVVFGSASGQLVKTVDGGSHWRVAAAIADTVNGVVADPKTSGILYVWTPAGIFKSNDGGESFSAKNDGLPSPGQVGQIAVAASDPSHLYAATYSGWYVSDTGADLWKPAAAMLLNLKEIEIDPSDARTAIAVGSGSLITRNFGVTWAPLALGEGNILGAAVFVRQDPSMIFVSSGSRLFRSSDAGFTWAQVAHGPPEESIETLAFSSSFLLAGLSASGVFRSGDGGFHWSASNSGLTAISTSDVAACVAVPERLYAASNGGAVFRSNDGGRHWIPTSPLSGATGAYAIAVDAVDPDAVYVIATGPGQFPIGYGTEGLFVTRDGGATWQGGLSGGITLISLVTDPVISGTIYLGRQVFPFGLYKSEDFGGTFQEIDQGFSVTASVNAIGVDPTAHVRIYASAPDGVFRSDDGGASWQLTGLSGSPLFVLRLIVGHDVDATVLAVNDGVLVRSIDHGSTWTTTAGLPHDPFLLLAADAARDRVFYAASGAQIFVSKDGGATWTLLGLSGLPGDAIMGLFGSADGRLHAATSAGVYETSIVPVLPTASANPAPIAETIR